MAFMRMAPVVAAFAALSAAQVDSWCPPDGNSCRRNGDRTATCSRGTGVVPNCFCSQGYVHPNGFLGKCVASGQGGTVGFTTAAVLSLRFSPQGTTTQCSALSPAAEGELVRLVEAVVAKPLVVQRRCPELTVGVAVQLSAAEAAALQQRNVFAELNAKVGNASSGYPNLRLLPAIVGKVATEAGPCSLPDTSYTMVDHLGRCNAMSCHAGAALDTDAHVYSCRRTPVARVADEGNGDWTGGEIAGVIASFVAVIVVCAIIASLVFKDRNAPRSDPATPRKTYSERPTHSPLPPLHPQAHADSPYSGGGHPGPSPQRPLQYENPQHSQYENPEQYSQYESPHSQDYYGSAPSVPPPQQRSRQQPQQDSYATGYSPASYA